MNIEYNDLCFSGKEMFRAANGLKGNANRNLLFISLRHSAIAETNLLMMHIEVCKECKHG